MKLLAAPPPSHHLPPYPFLSPHLTSTLTLPITPTLTSFPSPSPYPPSHHLLPLPPPHHLHPTFLPSSPTLTSFLLIMLASNARSQTPPPLSDLEDQVEKREESADIDELPSTFEPLISASPEPEPLTPEVSKKTPRVKQRSDDAHVQVKRLRLQYYINKVWQINIHKYSA